MKEGTYYAKNRERILKRLKKKYAEDADFRGEVNYRNLQNYRKKMKDENLKEEYDNKKRTYMKEYMRNYNKKKKSS
jgi:hypothetical protein